MITSLVALWVVAGVPAEVFERSGAFTTIETKPNETVSGRAVPGSVFREYRVQTTTPYGVVPLCELIFEWGSRAGDGPGIIHHAMLIDGADERVVYQQISQPIVAKRDFAFTIVRERLPSGACRVRFRSTNEKAPARPEGFVRMDKVWGEWLIEPAAQGSQVTYTLFSDPAGSVPAFLVHGPQQQSTRDAVVHLLARAKAQLTP